MRLRMPGLLTCAAVAGGVAVGYGAWRLGRLIYGIKKYRESAKAGALSADGFRFAGISEQAKALEWFVIDDQVMGGRSSSAIRPTAKGFIDFAGSINTNGGGFSSCRTLGDDEPLGIGAEAKFIEVTAVADSRQYKLTLHTADSWQMSVPTWAHDFHSENPGQQQSWKLPISNFVPSKQGRPVPGAVLDPSKITGVGINLSLYTMHGKPNPHFGDGPFKITLESLAVLY